MQVCRSGSTCALPATLLRGSAAVTAILCGGVAASQSASYSLYGNGCPTSGNNGCVQANGTARAPAGTAESRLGYAFETKVPTSGTTYGFQLLTGSRVSRPIVVKIGLHRSDNFFNPMPAPVAVGTMVIGTRPGWYPGFLSAPTAVRGGIPYFLSFEATTDMLAPVVPKTSGTLTRHWTRVANGTGSWGTSQLTRAWAFRVLCLPFGAEIPNLSHGGLPQLGRTMTVTLSRAPVGSQALLVLGSSDKSWQGVGLPLDLAKIGAPGCALLASAEVLLPTAVDAAGNAAVPLTVPNNPGLLGQRFFNQWVVSDPTANTLGIVVSPGAVGVVGK